MAVRILSHPMVIALVVLGAGCAHIDDDDPSRDALTDTASDWSWDPAWDTPDADTPEGPNDGLSDSTLDTTDLTDGGPDIPMDTTMDTVPDTSPDTITDTLTDTVTDPSAEPGPCSGTVVGGLCWYHGGEEESCATVCTSHGGYNEGTRTYAGSDGTLWNCNDVLDALGAAGTSTGSLSASGRGVGCFLMNLVNDRYWVSDTPTTADATYMLGRRACACNE